MPALGNITLADGQASPVNHVFKPVNIDKQDMAHYADNSATTPIGYPRLALQLRIPAGPLGVGASSKNSVYRGVVKVDVPVLEVTSPATGSGIQPAPTVAYVTIAKAEFVLPARSTLQDRKDARAYLVNALGNATVISMLHDLENLY